MIPWSPPITAAAPSAPAAGAGASGTAAGASTSKEIEKGVIMVFSGEDDMSMEERRAQSSKYKPEVSTEAVAELSDSIMARLKALQGQK